MAADEVHVNDIGTQFRLTVKDGTDVVDVSAASTLYIYFYKPDGTILTKTATLVNDGTDGLIQYTTVDGDINVVGRWKLQAYVQLGTSVFYSDVQVFKVHRNG